MELSQEDSKSSSEEEDRLEQQHDDTDTNRLYKCVFCKRGFTTAQALGGHMNIHRKDRAKTRHISVTKKREIYSSIGSKSEVNIVDYFTMERACNLERGDRFGEEWRWGLSLHIGPSRVHHDDDDKGKRDELDLELRLGQYDP